ncbi:MAG TPA: PLP-dependent cysteine synthase family protein [Anaerolineales bacterium]
MIETHRLIERRGMIDQVGNTPLIRLERVTAHLPTAVEVFGKAEWHNPSGSVKDRAAAEILRQALEAGNLANGRTLLDSSSGNMGIAYATLGAALGVSIRLVVPGNINPIRKQLLQALGVELTISDPLEGSDGARELAAELAAQHPERYFYADQYSNPANWLAHYRTTGPEIVRDTEGGLSHFVAGLGTTGTLMGTGRWIKEQIPNASIVGFQPNSPLNGLEGLKHLPTSRVPEIYDPSLPDEILEISTEQAHAMARRLAREEGLLVGASAAAAAVAALEVAERLSAGTVVALFPDSGLKYLDEPFWRQL